MNLRLLFCSALFVAANFFTFALRAEGTNFPLGFCTVNFPLAKAAGFDFAEARIREFARLSDADFEKYALRVRTNGLPLLTGYFLFPPEMKVVGTNVHMAEITNYLETVFVRCEALGIKKLVFGSGEARRMPPDFSKETAFDQLVTLGKWMASAAQKHGLTVVAEPLRHQEGNTINTGAEALQWVEAVNHPNFQMLVDIFHMTEEGEDPAIIVKAGAHLGHVHLSNPIGRKLPLSAEEFNYKPFFNALHQIGYHGTMSIETTTVDLAKDGPRTIEFVRAAYAAAAHKVPEK